MTTPFPFVAGSVLPAQSLNDITNLPINDQAASYTLVVGDAGKRVVMNVASANTVTVDDSVFTTGDTVFVANKGAGASTLTAGAGVTINSASGLELVQNQSGTLIALSASSFLFVLSAGPAPAVPAAGLTFITGSAFTTVTSFSLPDDTFTSTFLNYKMFVNITTVTADADFTVRLRAAGADKTSADYSTAFVGLSIVGTTANQASANATALNFAEGDGPTTVNYNAVFDILNPKATSATSIFANIQFRDKAQTLFEATRTGLGLSFFTDSCDSLSFISSVASSITGSFRVYGYADS